jgi:hypothetical protein
MCLSMTKKRVITRDQCRIHHATESPVWESQRRTKIAFLDPAYGGGDDCVIYHAEFGRSGNGKTVLAITDHRVIPILVFNRDDPRFKIPEDQIAVATQEELTAHGCPVENCGYDSFGKGTIGQAFAKVFGYRCPVPVDAGGRPTKRIVRQDLYAYDGTNRTNRLKTCDEHFDRFITELWFMFSYAIDSEQIRGLPEDAIDEGCQREYKNVGADKISIETKEKMKEQTGGKSPNNFDCCAGLLEIARRQGFEIERVGGAVKQEEEEEDWFVKEAERYSNSINSRLLKRA